MAKQFKLETLQKKVKKRFPNAKLVKDEYGLYYIMNDGENIYDEFFMPNVSTEREAWEQGWTVTRTVQNFNRTHPLKVGVFEDEKKISRMINRKMKSMFGS
jgi:hypothetical protein